MSPGSLAGMLVTLTVLGAACARPPRAATPAPAPASAPAPQVDDSRGGQLNCRQGSTTMQLSVPAGHLDEVRQLAARMGYATSDCVFAATR